MEHDGTLNEEKKTLPIEKNLEVELLQQIESDHTIRIVWKALPDGVQARVWRKKNGIPKHRLDGEEMKCQATELIDTGLENGVSYGYLICIQYWVGGRMCLSRGITTSLTPVSLPNPIDTFTVKRISETDLEAAWSSKNTDSEPMIFYSENSIPYQYGEQVSLEEVKQRLKQAEVQDLSNTKCRFQITGSPLLYHVVIMSVKQGWAIIGKSTFISTILFSVKGKRIVGKDLHLVVEWPENVEKMLILYREDTYPKDSDDHQAKRVIMTRQDFLDSGAFVIPNIQEKKYYFSLFIGRAETSFQSEGEMKFEQIYREEFSHLPKTIIYYSIEKIGVLKKRVRILFYSDQAVFQLPAIEIRQLTGTNEAPIKKIQGELISEIQQQEVNGKYLAEFSMSQFPKGTGIRPFFQQDSSYEKYRLKPISGTNHMIS